MATPAPTPRAPGTVPLPIGEVLRIANEYERGGRLDDAKRLLDHILGTAPRQGDALHLAGIVAFRQGDIAKALELMEGSLQHGIDTPLYLRNICEVYRAMGRLDEALGTARRATALAPIDPLCLHNQAVIHYHRLELDEGNKRRRQKGYIRTRLDGGNEHPEKRKQEKHKARSKRQPKQNFADSAAGRTRCNTH